MGRIAVIGAGVTGALVVAIVCGLAWRAWLQILRARRAYHSTDSVPGAGLSALLTWRRLGWVAGFLQSQDQFLGQDMQGPMAETDLPALGTVFATPVFFFQGEDDDMTPAQLARAYFDKITAPSKAYESVPGAVTSPS